MSEWSSWGSWDSWSQWNSWASWSEWNSWASWSEWNSWASWSEWNSWASWSEWNAWASWSEWNSWASWSQWNPEGKCASQKRCFGELKPPVHVGTSLVHPKVSCVIYTLWYQRNDKFYNIICSLLDLRVTGSTQLSVIMELLACLSWGNARGRL